MHRLAALLAVSRAGSLVTDPDTIYAHFQDFLNGISTKRFDAWEHEDRNRSASGKHTVPKLHRPLFVQKKIFIYNGEYHTGIPYEVAIDNVVDISSLGKQLDVLSFEEMGSTAEITPIGTAQSGKYEACLWDGNR